MTKSCGGIEAEQRHVGAGSIMNRKSDNRKKEGDGEEKQKNTGTSKGQDFFMAKLNERR